VSASRIVIGLAIVSLSSKLTRTTFLITLALVAAAAISYFLDGYLARRWNATSATGYVLDAMGDRAVHLALTLVMLLRYDFHLLIAWLLVFRDIAIYGLRVLSRDWLVRSREHRWRSVLHATGVRVWLGIYLLRDGLRVFTSTDNLSNVYVERAQLALITASIIFSYWSLYVALNWLIDVEHASIEHQET